MHPNHVYSRMLAELQKHLPPPITLSLRFANSLPIICAQWGQASSEHPLISSEYPMGRHELVRNVLGRVNGDPFELPHNPLNYPVTLGHLARTYADGQAGGMEVILMPSRCPRTLRQIAVDLLLDLSYSHAQGGTDGR